MQGSRVVVPWLLLGLIHGSLIASAGFAAVGLLSPGRSDEFRMVVTFTFGGFAFVALMWPIIGLIGQRGVKCPRCDKLVSPPMAEDDPPITNCPSCGLPVDQEIESQTSCDEIERISVAGTRVKQRLVASGLASSLVWAVLWVWPTTHRLMAEAGPILLDAIVDSTSSTKKMVWAGSKQSLASMQRAAEEGDAAAQDALGDLYRFSHSPDRNEALAIEWYRKAAMAGNSNAQYSLATMYQGGIGIPQDYNAAMTWHLKAANQGNVYAQLHLAQMYELGLGVAADLPRAIEWYRRAAAQNDDAAAAALARLRSDQN